MCEHLIESQTFMRCDRANSFVCNSLRRPGWLGTRVGLQTSPPMPQIASWVPIDPLDYVHRSAHRSNCDGVADLD
jgi:hypothetical protein